MTSHLQLFCVLAVASLSQALPQYQTPIPIVAQYQDGPNPDGSYQYSYQTANGISAQERGYLKNAGQPQLEAQVAEGSYQYTADDGTPISISYIADEGGFRAEGSAIPTPPPIPPEIQRALEYLRTLPQQEYDDNGNPIGAPVQQNYRPNYGKK
ncbi:endocuticle structural glycoprotein SgAbd-2-like [Macrosteles quadrilineatus]|uniref:endocuticle structural glycoprotein SgAbd-2-like n=1 Tax=Macrosteles quadrilineatus TaxID=74068 RepID=UPI0023E317B6|nr:endocuticle structural glycoprotein SgAbd-2-like [Macrosteles quadrilineatus]